MRLQALILCQDGLSIEVVNANIRVAKLIIVDDIVALEESSLNRDAVDIVCWCKVAVLVRWNRDRELVAVGELDAKAIHHPTGSGKVGGGIMKHTKQSVGKRVVNRTSHQVGAHIVELCSRGRKILIILYK